MQLQKQPNSWSCLPTAFAMAMDIPVADFLNIVGHDGSDIVHPSLPSPMDRRSFGHNEMIKAGYLLGYYIVPFEINIEQGYQQHPELSFTYSISLPVSALNHPGIVAGRYPNGMGHAVTWNPEEQQIFDPSGTTYSLSSLPLTMDVYWLCYKFPNSFKNSGPTFLRKAGKT